MKARVTARGPEQFDVCSSPPEGRCGQRFSGKPWGRAASHEPGLPKYYRPPQLLPYCYSVIELVKTKQNSIFYYINHLDL